MPSHYARALILLVCYVLTLHYCTCADDDDEPSASNSYETGYVKADAENGDRISSFPIRDDFIPESAGNGTSSSHSGNRRSATRLDYQSNTDLSVDQIRRKEAGKRLKSEMKKVTVPVQPVVASKCGQDIWSPIKVSSSWFRSRSVTSVSSHVASNPFDSIVPHIQVPILTDVNVLHTMYWSSTDTYIAERKNLLCFTPLSEKTHAMSIFFNLSLKDFFIGMLQLTFLEYGMLTDSFMRLKIITDMTETPEIVFDGHPSQSVSVPFYHTSHSRTILKFKSQKEMQTICLIHAMVQPLTRNFKLFSNKQTKVTFSPLTALSISTKRRLQSFINKPSVLRAESLRVLPFVFYKDGLNVNSDAYKVHIIKMKDNSSLIFSPLAVAVDHVKGNVLRASFRYSIAKQCSLEAFLVQSQSSDITDSTQLCAGTYLKARAAKTYLKSNIYRPNTGNMLAILIIRVQCTNAAEGNVATVKNIKISARPR